MSLSDDQVAHFFGGRNDVPTKPLAVNAADELDLEAGGDATGDLEGEIAVDVFETDTDIVIISPIAGVNPNEIKISAGEDSVTISGKRHAEHTRHGKNMIAQEIYWGSFERTVQLPVPCDVRHASAACKQGVLTVKIPKSSKAIKQTIKVKTED